MSRPSRSLELRIPRRLESPNVWQGKHWRTKHRISQAWEREIWVWLAQRTGTRSLNEVLVCMNADGTRQAGGRMRVEVERHVPSKRNFILDDDNLRFAVKPLLDALKRQGYIRNDSRKWLDHPTPTQHVSRNGSDYTVFRISPAEPS